MLKFPFILVKHDVNINFFRQRYIAYVFSILITVATVTALYIKGFNLSIDFTGGVIMEVKGDDQLSIDSVRTLMNKLDYNSSAHEDNQRNITIRLQPKNQKNPDDELHFIKLSITDHFGNIEFRKIDYVGPKVGEELVYKGVIAMILSLIAMMAYVTFRFNWVCGVGVIIALIHDAMATIGFYALSGFEFDITSIAALLTIIGYSVNDSVVIYDRIRENLRKSPKTEAVKLINLSINETLSRTVMTAVTTLIVCASIYLFGGAALKGFGAALFFGVAFGTYSSVYISSSLLTLFKKKSLSL